MILESNANVVCLQECTQKFFEILFADERILSKFKSVGFQKMSSWYGVCILSEWPAANIYEYTYARKDQVD